MFVALAAGLSIGALIGYLIAPTGPTGDNPRRSWRIYVEPTNDPSVYRGVYEDDSRVKYSVTGTGVTGALRNLADEIDR